MEEINMPSTNKIILSMPQDMYDTVDRLAKKNGNSMQAIVRQMISMYLQNIEIASEIVKDTEKLEHIMRMMGTIKDE
jgi:metal-responsive CopG/Arc/MetJ family transcriptional regulator